MDGLPDFEALTVAVVGDLVADHDLFARPRKLSREAPVLVFAHERDSISGGGAANVALNLRSLGARVRVFGVLGRDASGREVARVLEEAGVETDGLAFAAGWRTPTKTRVLAAEPRRRRAQVLRIDREPEGEPEDGVRAAVSEGVAALAGGIDALVLSDYGYGMVRAPLAPAVRAVHSGGATVVLDPRGELDAFAGLTAVTPNLEELACFTGRAPEDLEEPQSVARAASELARRSRAEWVLATRGNLGMALFGGHLGPDGAAVPASGGGDATDVCGAGDTAAAVFALALAAGASGVDAMVIANAASGVVVMEHGAARCSREALAAALARAPTARSLSQLSAP